jgi:PAS domain S-box-containing protein
MKLFEFGRSGSVVFAAGAASAALGVAAFVSWYTGSRLPGLDVTALTLIHSAALGFLFAGTGLIATALRRPRPALIYAVTTLAIGALRAGGTRTDEDFCPAIGFVLAGVALVLANSRAGARHPLLTLGGAGSVISAIGIASLAVNLSSAPKEYLPLLLMPPSAALGFAVLGTGVMALSWGEGRRGRHGPWISPLLVATGVLSGTLYIWHAAHAQHAADVAAAAETASRHMKRELQSQVRASLFGLVRMGRRWELRGQPGKGDWESDAGLYISHHPSYRELAWVDPELRCRWTASAAADPAIAELISRPDGRARNALETARDERRIAISRAFRVGSEYAVLITVPLFPGDKFAGSIAGLFRLKPLFETTLQENNFRALSAYDGEEMIYTTGENPVEARPAWPGRFTFSLHGAAWQITFQPRLSPLSKLASPLAPITLGAGLLTALLSSLAVHLALVARFRAREAESVNLELEREVSERKQAEADVARARDDLEARVRRRTAELARANTELTAEIAERKRAEETLRASEERYRELFDSANDLVYTHDLQGNLTSLNKAAERASGYPREEALKMNISQIVAPEYLETARQMIMRKLGGEATTIYELVIVTRDGRKLILEVNTHLLYRNGNPVGVHGIAREITERKRLEEQFRQSQKMEAIGRLAGGVAHDFNNLLTVIGAYSQMLIENAEHDQASRSYAQEILWAADRASALTSRLLAFSRRQVVQPRIVDLNTLIENMRNMLRRLIGEDVELITKLDPELGRVKVDPSQIEQVIMNLAVNARDAMPSGGALTLETANLEVGDGEARTAAAPGAGSWITLAVSDTGHGMDQEIRNHLFEPFFTTKASGKGTGLGLSTVYGIVKLSAGEIMVDTEPGKGSTFRIYLPQVEPELEEAAHARSRGETGRGQETILLVEDEPGVRRLVRRMLAKQGYRVLEAANGHEGLELCERHKGPIHMLLTDIVMPKISGRELAQRVARQRPQTRVLYMTGYTDDTIMHHGVLDAGLILLQKPFRADALASKVREVLDRSS